MVLPNTAKYKFIHLGAKYIGDMYLIGFWETVPTYVSVIAEKKLDTSPSATLELRAQMKSVAIAQKTSGRCIFSVHNITASTAGTRA